MLKTYGDEMPATAADRTAWAIKAIKKLDSGNFARCARKDAQEGRVSLLTAVFLRRSTSTKKRKVTAAGSGPGEDDDAYQDHVGSDGPSDIEGYEMKT